MQVSLSLPVSDWSRLPTTESLCRSLSRVVEAAMEILSRVFCMAKGWVGQRITPLVSQGIAMVTQLASRGGAAATHPLVLTAVAISAVVGLLMTPARKPLLMVTRVIPKAGKEALHKLREGVSVGAKGLWQGARILANQYSPIIHGAAILVVGRAIASTSQVATFVLSGMLLRFCVTEDFLNAQHKRVDDSSHPLLADPNKTYVSRRISGSMSCPDLLMMNQHYRIGNVAAAALAFLARRDVSGLNPTLSGLVLGYQLASLLLAVPSTIFWTIVRAGGIR